MIRDRLIRIDLQRADVQKTDIIINQGNVNSFNLSFRVYDGAEEIAPSNFTAARITLSQNNRLFYNAPIASDLSVILKQQALTHTGVVIGQLDLEFTDGNLATTYFSFSVLKNLATLSISEREIYIVEIAEIIREVQAKADGITDILAEAQATQAEIEQILIDLQDIGFITQTELDNILVNYVTVVEVEEIVRETTLEDLPTFSNERIQEEDSLLSAMAKMQGQVNARLSSDNIRAGENINITSFGYDLIINSTATDGGGVISVAGRTGEVDLTKDDVGLYNVDNTADLEKNVLSATTLTTPRAISITGDATASATFDGSADISLNTTVAKVNGIYARNNGGVIQLSTDNVNWQGIGGGSNLQTQATKTASALYSVATDTILFSITGKGILKDLISSSITVSPNYHFRGITVIVDGITVVSFTYSTINIANSLYGKLGRMPVQLRFVVSQSSSASLVGDVAAIPPVDISFTKSIVIKTSGTSAPAVTSGTNTFYAYFDLEV